MPEQALEIQRCATSQIPALRRMLADAGLPDEDVHAEMAAGFLLAIRDGEICGAIGMEQYGSDGLLRSLVVDPGYRGEQLGRTLVDALEREAVKRGVRTLYLLTDTAEDYFPRLGYALFDRQSVPTGIRATAQFRELCPASAACLRKTLVLA